MLMRKPVRPCLHRNLDGTGCPNLTEGTWCRLHAPEYRSPTTAVSSSRDHRRKRERLVRMGPPWVRSICNGLITSADDMQLHHVVVVSNGGAKGKTAPSHALCNRRCDARQPSAPS